MFSDYARQPLYLRSSSSHAATARASDDDAFWRALRDRMASRIHEAAGDDDDAASSSASWMLGFASLDGAFAAGDDGDKTAAVPGLVRVPGSDSESETEGESDDESVSSSPSVCDFAKPARKGVSFTSDVEVKTIPHFSSYSSSERRRMYASSVEIHRNKKRNRKEFRYDNCDWRNATEEKDMGVCEVTGELVHPAHDYELNLNYAC